MPLSLRLKWKLERIGAQTHFAQGAPSAWKEVARLDRARPKRPRGGQHIPTERGSAMVLPNGRGASQFSSDKEGRRTRNGLESE